MNDWMNDAFILRFIVYFVHPNNWGGGGAGVSALTTHQLQVERRERQRANQVNRDYKEAMIDKGQWWEIGQDTGVTPLLFIRSAMGFLMTTESQDLGLTSHPKNGAFWQYSVPVNILGRYDPHRPQGEHPLLASLTSLPAAT